MISCSKKKTISRRLLPVLLPAIIAVSAISCVENDRSLGNDLLPGESQIKVGVKTFSNLPITNMSSDSVQAANNLNMLIGTLSDPLYGTVTCNTASAIQPYSDSTDFGDSPELISAYLNLSIDSTYYIDDNQEGIHQRIRIYKLTSPLGNETGYCNSMSPEYYDKTPVTVGDPVIYGEGEIKIELRNEFAQELLNTTPEEFRDHELFSRRIHGLYMEVDPPLNSTEGGRLNCLDMGNSNIVLNYTLKDPDRNITSVDTTESFAFGYRSTFNYFTTSSAHLENENPGKELYLEGLSGIKPHIKASGLKAMIEDWIHAESLEGYTMVISRAELKFPYEKPEDYGKFDIEHPEAIFAFTRIRSTDTVDYYSPLPEVYSNSNIGNINRSIMEYSMDITSYLQDIMLTDMSELDSSHDLWIAPLKYKVNILDEKQYEFDNYSYNKVTLNGPAAERKPSLTVTYGLIAN